MSGGAPTSATGGTPEEQLEQTKAREKPRALAEAQRVKAEAELVGKGREEILAALESVKAQFGWIKRFELRREAHNLALYLIASEERVGEFVPIPTGVRRQKIDQYTKALADMRRGIDDERAAYESAKARSAKPNKYKLEPAQKLVDDARKLLDQIDADAQTDEVLFFQIDSLRTDVRAKLEEDLKGMRAAAEASLAKVRDLSAYSWEMQSGTLGQTIACTAVEKAQQCIGKTVTQVLNLMGPATEKNLATGDGADAYTWRFEDNSSIRLDIPGVNNGSFFQINREPHIAILAPNGDHLSSQGVVVPANSDPAHGRIYRG